MRLYDVLKSTDARLLSADADLEGEVTHGFASDLMSDVLRFDLAQSLLVTGLVNPQVVRTAEMADASAILLVRGKQPLPETLSLAREVGIPLLVTQMIMFEACGRLYAAGLKACSPHNGHSAP